MRLSLAGYRRGEEKGPESSRAFPTVQPPASALGSHACVALSSGLARLYYTSAQISATMQWPRQANSLERRMAPATSPPAAQYAPNASRSYVNPCTDLCEEPLFISAPPLHPLRQEMDMGVVRLWPAVRGGMILPHADARIRQALRQGGLSRKAQCAQPIRNAAQRGTILYRQSGFQRTPKDRSQSGPASALLGSGSSA